MSHGGINVGDLTADGSVTVGHGNTVNSNNTTIFNINLPKNSPFSTNSSVADILIKELTNETAANKKYKVFVCAPSDSLSSEKAKQIYIDIMEKIKSINVDVIVGGGKEIIEDGNPYPHLNEYSLCQKKECNAIIIVADDYSTFSQFSLLSHLKHYNKLSNIDMYVIYEDEIINHEFMKKGPFDFFEEIVKGHLFKFSDYEGSTGDEICSKIDKHRLFSSN
ncbi:hypothetical protein ACIL2W_000961 [Vibrio parahaemolyticus]|nr:hypothetical protein [Vibrio parahaemolyticus]